MVLHPHQSMPWRIKEETDTLHKLDSRQGQEVITPKDR